MTLSCPPPALAAPMLWLGCVRRSGPYQSLKEKDSLGRRRAWGPPRPFVGEEAQILPVEARNTSGWDPRPSPGAESRYRAEWGANRRPGDCSVQENERVAFS